MQTGFGISEAPSPLTIFLSSTFYDLHSIREELQGHLKKLGFIPVLFEAAGAVPTIPAPVSALTHASQADLCLLIIGSRYGTLSDDNMLSWVHREFRLARDLGKPVITFIDSGVLAKYELYHSRPHPDFWTPDEQSLFNFIHEVSSLGSRFPFDSLPNLKTQLTFQLASYFGYLIRRYGDLEAFAPSSIATWCRVAIREGKRGEFGKALFCYRQALALDNTDKKALYGVAKNLWRLGRNTEAESYCRQGVKDFPEVPKFRGILCQILRDDGQLDEALSEAKALVEKFPKDDRAWGTLSVIHELRGEHDEAIEAAQKAYAMAGKNTRRLHRLLDLGANPDRNGKTEEDETPTQQEDTAEEIW